MNLIKISNSIYTCEFPTGNVVNGVTIKVNIWLVLNGTDIYIIDTGFDYMTKELIPYLNALGTPKALLVTHGHLDHILGAHRLVREFGIPRYANQLEIDEIDRGIAPYPTKEHKLTCFFTAFDEKVLEEAGLTLYTTPGHSPVHTIFYHEKDNVLMVGDLFTTTEKQLLPPINKFTPNMTESIDNGAVIDSIKPALITSAHGENIVYNETLYPQLVLLFREE